MASKLTLEEIARAAKVSVATASRAINNTGRVSPEIARRVRNAVAKLGANVQRPDQARTICFLLANRAVLHPFHAHVLMGAQEYAAGHEYQLLFYPFQYRPDTSPEDIRLPLLFERRGLVDGYIVGGINWPNLLQLLAHTGVPFSVLGNNVLGDWQPEHFDVVWMDDVAGAHELTKYLQSLGHRNIWFLGGSRFPVARMREGYSRAMQEASLEPHVLENDSDSEHDAGYLAAKTLLSGRADVTAVFAHSDTVAHGVFEAVLGCGLKIPEQISVVGFGDRPEAAALSPPLTTVWGYPEQVGRRLAEVVLNRIKTHDLAPQQCVLPMRLIKRDSCFKTVAEMVAGTDGIRPLEPLNGGREAPISRPADE